MNEPTHAPGWRGRPRRIGPVESDYNLPRWQIRLEAVAPLGCTIMAGAAIILAVYCWTADYFAGHL